MLSWARPRVSPTLHAAVIVGYARRQCLYTPHEIARYLAKISGPLLDRIDLHEEARGISPALEVEGMQFDRGCLSRVS